MKTAFFCVIFPFCAVMNIFAQTAEEFARIWDKQHVSNILPSNVRHRDLQNYLSNLKKLGVKVSEAGRSFEKREIYQIEWGKGTTKVLMWSQMHGDEPTATSALIDVFTFLQKNRTKIAWVKKLEQTLTIRAVPMLNPDGEERYQRRNAQNLDINRDAEKLTTPEGRLLKKLRDEWQPEIGFNLHNQQDLTTVGATAKQAAISLLAVSGSPTGATSPGFERNQRVISLMISALEKFIPGHIGRYDDDYLASAFGDRISESGTPVILIETGALQGKDEMYLVKLNFIADLVALQSLADGSEKTADAKIYQNTPFNSSGNLSTYIFRGASVVNPQTGEITVSDLAANAERRRAGIVQPVFVQRIGDLSAVKGLHEYDAHNFYLVPRQTTLAPESKAEFLFYKKSRKIDWKTPNLEQNFPPDAIFSGGKWLKPLPY